MLEVCVCCHQTAQDNFRSENLDRKGKTNDTTDEKVKSDNMS